MKRVLSSLLCLSLLLGIIPARPAVAASIYSEAEYPSIQTAGNATIPDNFTVTSDNLSQSPLLRRGNGTTSIARVDPPSPTSSAVYAALSDTTVYASNFPGWQSALNSKYSTEDFNDTSLNSGLAVAATWLNAGISSGKWNDRLIVAGEKDPGNGQTGPTTTTWTFATPVYSFGGTWDPGTPGGPGAGISVSINSNGRWIYIGHIPNTYVNQFWGFIAGVPFTQVSLASYDNGGWCETYAVDNIVYSLEPILLLHGLNGRVSDWNDFKAYLVSHGYPDYAIDAVDYTGGGGVNTLRSIATMAGDLKKYIDTNYRYVPEVDIVSHSMGGLVARTYLNNGGSAHTRVKRLIMIGTPNNGSELLKIPGDVLTVLEHLSVPNLKGTTDLIRAAAQTAPDNSIRQMSPNSSFLSSYLGSGGLVPNQTYLIAGTNDTWGDFTWHGIPVGKIYRYLVEPYLKGPDDGVVRTASVNVGGLSATPFNATHIWGGTLAELQNTAIMDSVLQTLRTSQPASSASASPGNVIQAVPQNDNQFLLAESGTVQPQGSKTYVTPVNTVDEATFLVTWNGTALSDIVLTSPLGEVIPRTATASDRECFYYYDPNDNVGVQQYRLTTPPSGNWSLKLQAGSASAVDYTAVILAKSALSLSLSPDKSVYNPGDSIYLTSSLTDNITPVTSATVKAEIGRPNGVSEVISMYDDGAHNDGPASDGVYGNRFTSTNLSGTYRMTASATNASSSFKRQSTTATVWVEQNPDLAVYSPDITFSNNNPQYGDNITISSAIRNIGDATAANATIEFYDGAPAMGALIGQKTLSVPQNGVANTAVPWVGTPGAHEIHVLVSPYSPFFEKSYANNEASQNITVWAPPAVTTNTSTEITFYSAQLNGNLTFLGSAGIVNVSFQWGAGSGSYTNETPAQSMNATGSFTYLLTGLSASAIYHFRAKAVSYTTSYGIDSAVTTIAPSPQFLRKWGTYGSANGQFRYPIGVAVDASSNVYVADTENNRIQKFTSSGVFITGWGTLGSGNGQFNYPTGVAVDASGYVYVADYFNNRIQKFTDNGTFITKWGAYGSADGQFYAPFGLAVSASGSVYVADLNSSRIQKFTNNGTFVTKWGTYGSANGQFDYPIGVAVDASGYVYVADAFNSRIQKFTDNGTFAAKWGTYGTGNGQFDVPFGLAVDSSGNVYVVDAFNSRIQKFTNNGVFVTKWGTYGSANGQFSYPAGVAVDASGYVYVADYYNSRIQVFAEQLLVVTSAASNITSSTATLNGALASQGTASSSAVSFEWGTASGNFTRYTPPQVMTSTGNFSANLSGLTTGTPYYFRTKADGNTTTYGSELSFTTASLVSISVAPPAPALLPGRSQQFTANGTYSDNSTADVTASVTWSSSNTSVASIGSSGLAAGLAAGRSTVTAARGNVAGNATLTVNASVEVNSGQALALMPNISVSNVPVAINGIPASGAGIEKFIFNLSWNKDVIRVDNITAANVSGFQLRASIPNNTTGTANVSGDRLNTRLVGNTIVAALGISPVGAIGNSSSVNVTIVQLIDQNSNPVPATVVNATAKIMNLTAETSLSQTLSGTATGVIVNEVCIDRFKDPSDNSTAQIPGGINAYSATANITAARGIQLVALNGVSPFASPTFDSITGVFSVAAVSSPPQASDTAVAELVLILNGDATMTGSLVVSFNSIGSASAPGLSVPEERCNTIAYRRGNAKTDDAIDIFDALYIVQYVVGQRTIGQLNALNAASVKHDGAGGDKIDIFDALFIAQYVVGQRNAFFQ